MLAAISKDDTEKDVQSMASKLLKAKLWDDVEKDPPARVSLQASAGLPTPANSSKWKLGVMDIEGEVLCGGCYQTRGVSQF